jgi:hypothetical protein
MLRYPEYLYASVTMGDKGGFPLTLTILMFPFQLWNITVRIGLGKTCSWQSRKTVNRQSFLRQSKLNWEWNLTLKQAMKTHQALTFWA